MQLILGLAVAFVVVVLGVMFCIWKSPNTKRSFGIMLIASAAADEERRAQYHMIEKSRRIAEDDMRVSHGMRPVHFVAHSSETQAVEERRKR
jgi:hypothetical protein